MAFYAKDGKMIGKKPSDRENKNKQEYHEDRENGPDSY